MNAYTSLRVFESLHCVVGVIAGDAGGITL